MKASAAGDFIATTDPELLRARPKNLDEAARQFEALLIQQLLKSARGEQGWFGAAEDAGSSTAAELAEEQFARALATRGGLGLSARIVAGLSGNAPPPEKSATPAVRGVFTGRLSGK